MDKSGLIPIGRFAKLTDLSPRLLRRLDERGLLSPVFVDPDTRYRYYDLGQTRVASLVHLGRQLGLTMDQMADLIEASERGTCAPTCSDIATASPRDWRTWAACSACSTRSSRARGP